MEKSRQKLCDGSSIDRLSALPDVILCHILSFLPTKLSVATAILSKRWMFLWAHVPNLKFKVEDHDPEFTFDRNFYETIYNVMLLYRVENMNKFKLYYMDVRCTALQLEICVTEAITRSVKILDLSVVILDVFPSCIFTCKSLVKLKLHGCGSIPASGDICLPALKKLCLIWVMYESGESLSRLLSGCPVLEELTIDRMDPDEMFILRISSPTIRRLILGSSFSAIINSEDTYRVKIDTPALRYLEVFDSISEGFSAGALAYLLEARVYINNAPIDEGSDGEISDNDAPIEENGDFDFDNDAPVEGDVPIEGDVDFDIDAPIEGEANEVVNNDAQEEGDVLYCRSVLEFVGRLCNVKYLKLSSRWMQVHDSEFSNWTVKFYNLTKLEMYADGDWRFIPTFLENADNLEYLMIRTDNDCTKYWLEPKQVPTCLSSRLGTVIIHRFGCTYHEFNMVGYILRNAKVLKRMEISTSFQIDMKEKFEALKMISLFKRGSVDCELAFH